MPDTKISIIALIIAGIIGGILLTGEGTTCLELNDGDRCLTNTKYSELKEEMKTKFLAKETFNYQEYELFIAVLDKEAKQGHFENIQNVNEDNLIEQLLKSR